MAIGDNTGGQLNVLVFEVGMLVRDQVSGEETAITLAIHPLLTAPATITYSDRSRSMVQQTGGSSVKTTGGRALQAVSIDGTFGVESRGIGPQVGTGDLRFKRFKREIVRLGEALFREDVDEAIRVLASTPGLAQRLQLFDETTTTFYVNFYDFWHEERFEVQIVSFDSTKAARRGAATGATHYRLQLREVGPIVGGGTGDQLISLLFQGLTVWTDINALLESYRADALVAAQLAVPAVVVAQLDSTVNAVVGQLDSATGIMSGQSLGAVTDDTTAFFGNVAALIGAIDDAVDSLRGRATNTFDNEPGQVDWRGAIGEGGNRELVLQDELNALLDLEDAARYQQIAGALFGLDPGSYQDFVSGSGADELTAPELAGAIEYAMRQTDTARSMEERFGVSWDTILKINNLTPDEALVPGTVVRIPQLRQRGTQRIDGLPVFGSHIGKAAWGVDLALELRGDADGRPVLVAEEEALEQGAIFLAEAFGAELLEKRNSLPEAAQPAYLRLLLQTLFLSDKRFLSLDDVQIVETGVALDIDVTLSAINGGSIRTGGNR